MAVEISFIRHAETTANRDGLWQGQGDSPLSDRGERQLDRLRDRLARITATRARAGGAGRPRIAPGERSNVYDLVVSSDLGRAMDTAAAVGDSVENDVTWREADVGAWEGLTREEVWARYRDEVEALRGGERVQLGGGESYVDLVARVDGGLDKLLARLDDGDKAAVVTHGGVIGAISAGVLGMRERPRPWPVARLANTSITTLRIDGDRRQVAAYNDAAHVDGDHGTLGTKGQFVTLIRHGQTTANVAGRWAGITDVPLTDDGRREAEALAAARDGDTVIYSSALQRARATADAVAVRNGIDRHEHPDLGEMSFGQWENLRPDEIVACFGDEWRQIYDDGHDRPRGTTGETYAAVAGRMAGAIAEITERHQPSDVTLVSHGGAIRAYVAATLGLTFRDRHRIAEPANTAVCRVVIGERASTTDGSARQRTVLVDYNVTAHLEH